MKKSVLALMLVAVSVSAGAQEYTPMGTSREVSDLVEFNPDPALVVDMGTVEVGGIADSPKAGGGGASTNAITAQWLPFAAVMNAPARNTIYRFNFNLAANNAGNPTQTTWTLETLAYTWLVSGGWTNDQKNMDIMACVHYDRLPWRACGDVRKTIYTPEPGTSNFAVSFPTSCYLCAWPTQLSLFLSVPNNPLDPSGSLYASNPISVTSAAGTGRLYYTP